MKFIYASLVLLSTALTGSAMANEPLEIFWEDLVPEGHVAVDTRNSSSSHEGSEQNWVQPNLDAPVVQKYNGKTVSLPGFVVPLEGDNESITEFLLVPYFGACIHVPPPPPNQIVHVTMKNGVPIDSLYDAIVVTGVMQADSWSGEIAKTGYKIAGVGVAPCEL